MGGGKGETTAGHLDSPRAHASTFFHLGQPASINSSGRKMMDVTIASAGVLFRFRCFLFVASAFKRSTLEFLPPSHVHGSAVVANHRTLRIARENTSQVPSDTEPRRGISKRMGKYPSAGEISFSRVRHTTNHPRSHRRFFPPLFRGFCVVVRQEPD